MKKSESRQEAEALSEQSSVIVSLSANFRIKWNFSLARVWEIDLLFGFKMKFFMPIFVNAHKQWSFQCSSVTFHFTYSYSNILFFFIKPHFMYLVSDNYTFYIKPEEVLFHKLSFILKNVLLVCETQELCSNSKLCQS